MEFLSKNLIVSTPWKIIIPFGNSVRNHIYGLYKSIWVGNDFFIPVSFMVLGGGV